MCLVLVIKNQDSLEFLAIKYVPIFETKEFFQCLLEAFKQTIFAYFHSMHIRPMYEGGHYFVVTSLWDTLYVVFWQYFGRDFFTETLCGLNGF